MMKEKEESNLMDNHQQIGEEINRLNKLIGECLHKEGYTINENTSYDENYKNLHHKHVIVSKIGFPQFDIMISVQKERL